MRHALLRTRSLEQQCANYIERYGHQLSVNGFTIKTVAEARDRIELLKLRATVYDREMGWVKAQENGLEVDPYDIYSSHFSITNPKGTTIATMRTTESEHPWMATDCYNGLFEEEALQLKSVGAVELSRFCIDEAYRSIKICEGTNLIEFMAIWAFIQSLSQGIGKSYFVTHSFIGMVLKRCGFYVTDLSDQISMEDGCVIQSFEMDNERSLEAAINNRSFLQSLF